MLLVGLGVVERGGGQHFVFVEWDFAEVHRLVGGVAPLGDEIAAVAHLADFECRIVALFVIAAVVVLAPVAIEPPPVGVIATPVVGVLGPAGFLDVHDAKVQCATRARGGPPQHGGARGALERAKRQRGLRIVVLEQIDEFARLTVVVSGPGLQELDGGFYLLPVVGRHWRTGTRRVDGGYRRCLGQTSSKRSDESLGCGEAATGKSTPSRQRAQSRGFLRHQVFDRRSRRVVEQASAY